MAQVRGADPGTLETVQRVDINLTADGDNTLVAAAGAGIKIKVIALALSAATTAGQVQVKSAATILGRINLALNTPIVLPFQNDPEGGAVPWFETAANAALILNNGAGVDSVGTLLYIAEA